MQVVDGQPVYAATDLVGFLACAHLTDLERSALARKVKRPIRDDPELDAIIERGYEHEQLFVEELKGKGRSVVDLDSERGEDEDRGDYYRRQAERTREAIERGEDVIFQACFFDGTWLGFADFLLRVEDPDAPLGWSYEVADTKLAHKVKASALLQICVYNEMLEAIQGVYPKMMHVALGGKERETKSFRTADYTAYYRMAKRLFMETTGAPLPTDYPPPPPSYPEPVEHCGVCRWDEICSKGPRADHHLGLVAGIATRTRAELTERGTGTRRELAVLELPLVPKLENTRAETLLRIREQARLQVEGEDAGKTLYELLEPTRTDDGALDTTKGLLKLPEPSPGDLYLDLEGDPFAGDEGIDYLFGILEPGQLDENGDPLFHAFWSQADDGRITAAAEQRAFEQTIDLIIDRLRADPNLHVYHYAAYEPSHLGMLMGRYMTRQEEVDELFRGDTLVDLFSVVRQGIRASVESYSIKKMEPLYGFEREIELRDAGSSIAEFERWLRKGGESGDEQGTLKLIEDYNRDDVISTWLLRDWLETQRTALGEQLGEELPQPVVVDGEADKELSAWLQEVNEVRDPLLAKVTDDDAERRADPVDSGTWLMANLLGWHRREEKPDWWRYFSQLEATDEEQLEAKEPLAMLEMLGQEDEKGRIFRYRYPEQDFDVGKNPTDPATGKDLPVVETIADRNEIVLRFPRGRDIAHPKSLVAKTVVPARGQEQRLLDIGRSVLEYGIAGAGPYRAARDLLMRHPPRIDGHAHGTALHLDGESALEAARRLVVGLDHSTLAVQGPPGSGKTYAGGRMVLDLVAAGKKVGVTAGSHKVIGKLLDDVLAAQAEHPAFGERRQVRIGQKPGDSGETTCSEAEPLGNADQVRDALAADEVDVVGGTAWLWASDKVGEALDVLFIDEAGQFSLANAVAVSASAGSLVLLGDPQQLDQPLKGSHPIGAERSALAHLLDGAAVMPPERGLFMEKTWRLHPAICDYTSEVFYEGALQPETDNERQALAGVGTIDGEGIRVINVDHAKSHNDSSSPEEAGVIAELVCDLLGSGAAWTDRESETAAIEPTDILIITPYNAQRKLIGTALRARGERCAEVPVGTVDKFQGQQAPISIYSMASSTPEDAPRGMEFLYSLNRLNVATSRARCLTLVVSSPALVRARAKSPRQMQLANALCRLREVAEVADNR
ncbi:MAG: TM0106 family RecB-like putative nuclease [Chloroflexota bacterium]